MTEEGARGRRAEVWCAALLAAFLGLFWTLPWLWWPPERTWGWDESMHAELGAVRMLLALRGDEWRRAIEALLDCDQYPFVWPAVLAAVQLLTGVSELAARTAGTWAWCVALFGLFLLGRELVAVSNGAPAESRRNDAWVPWLAMGLGALCPLALAYSGTLFLETPFACLAVYSLWAWLRRKRGGEAGGARRDVLAGALLTAALFVKFNYGVLLGCALVLDWSIDLVQHARGGGLRRFLIRSARLWVIPVAALAWWLLLPMPGGVAVGARHRAAFFAYLGGNLEHAPTPWRERALFWCGAFAPSARLLALEIVGVALALREIRRPAVRSLALVLFAAGLPVWLHPFQLDRFLVPEGPAIWVLAALGIARILPAERRPRLVALAALVVLTLARPAAEIAWIADRTGTLAKAPAVRELQLQTIAGWSRLDPARPLPSAGLLRAEADAILDLVAGAARADERVGWLGLSSELSPAAVHIGLLQRGGSRERLLRDSIRPMDVTFEGVDPAWDDQRLAEYASEFDVIFTTEPPDLRDRPSRRFIRDYRERLLGVIGWRSEELGVVALERPLREPLEVHLYACRPVR